MKQLYRAEMPQDKTIFEIREIDTTDDLDRIWKWWNAPHVTGRWSFDVRLGPIAGERRPYTIEDLGAYLKKMLHEGHLLPAILRLNAVDIGYTEGYEIGSSPLANHPMLEPNDRGFHLLIGSPEFVGRGVGTFIMEHIIKWQFTAHPKAKRVGGEPKFDNIGAIKSLLKLPGSRREEDMQLPHKKAAVVIIERDGFFAKA